ncbi:hypothetical protein CONPUDRAFT_34278, partial [Coniophora puteana RWD-64-598 SS2]
YRLARKAADHLGGLDPKYQPLEEKDLEARSAAIHASVRGTKNKHLPWIWRVEVEEAERSDKSKFMDTFDRIQWMRAKCRRDRWEEELILLHEEMKRVPKSFMHKATQW